MTKTIIQDAASEQQLRNTVKAKQSINSMINSLLDQEGLRRRFDELLGDRTPQFMSSIVSLLNTTPQLMEAFYQSPMTIIQSALKAATFDLPIDPNLGFAYIVPFKNKGVPEATFIMGYKGMQQLALRTGAYKTLNVIDIREGELRRYDRLTEDIELDFIENEMLREDMPIIGYVGYFRLINGTEKTIYMSLEQIKAHEKKNRKGSVMGKGWREDFDSMCSKTVMRRLIGKWGLMSINYQQADARTIAAAEAIAIGRFDDEDDEGDVSGSAYLTQGVVVESEPEGEEGDINQGEDRQEDIGGKFPESLEDVAGKK